jgi:HlyD family secretion protein
MQGRRRLLIGVLAMLAVAGALVYSLRWWQPRQPANLLRLQGHLEATETDLSFKVPGLIEQIYFQEGDWVTSGQKAAVLEAKDLKDGIAKARADLAAAKANLAKMETGYRPQEVKEAQAQAGKTGADLANKRLDYERYENLYRRKVVAGQTRDKAESDYLMAKEDHQNALLELNLRREGYRAEDIDQAREQAKAAQAALDLALTQLGYATISSPVNGVVLVRPMEPGMTAAVGSPVLTLGDLDNIYLEGYIPESDLARVKFGMKAYITTDSSLGKQYPAWISFINSKAEFTPKTVETFKERVTLVYRTKIRAQNLNYDLKPGMPAEAVILLDQQDSQAAEHPPAR